MFYIMTFNLVQNHCVIDLIKQIDLLEFMMGLDIYYYVKYDAIYNRIRYLLNQKVILHMFSFIITQKPKLIHMTIYLQKKPWLYKILQYSLSQFLIYIKIIIITIYFQKNVHINKRNLIYYDRIYVSELIDVNKAIESKECDFVTNGVFQIKV